MAKQTGMNVDEVRVSQIVITAGTPKLIVVGVLGTRDGDDRFVWGAKEQWEFYPADNQPVDENGQPFVHVRTIPDGLLADVRELIVALEDALQAEVDEDSEPLPEDFSRLKERGYAAIDPRVSATWAAGDGHNGAVVVPTPRSRLDSIRKEGQ